MPLEQSSVKSTVTVNSQYDGFFTNDVIFSPWNHDAIAWTCFDDDIWKWVPFSYLVSFLLHIVLSPVFHLHINNISYCYSYMVDIFWYFIVRNFRGKKISRISRIGPSSTKLNSREKCFSSSFAKLNSREKKNHFFAREIKF